MSYFGSTEWRTDVQKGLIPGHSIVHKFGRNSAVSTTVVPLALGAIYNTPQVGSASTLRVKAGNANDTAAGSGAREITLEGLDETGAMVTEAVATAGASASSTTSATFIRLFRAYVSASGTYATVSTGSHDSDIVIENGAGGTDWATISSTDLKRAQTEIGAYSVPLGNTAHLYNFNINVDSTKQSTILIMVRKNILETSAPFAALRILNEYGAISGVHDIHKAFTVKLEALTDIVFLAKTGAGVADVSIEMDILLIED